MLKVGDEFKRGNTVYRVTKIESLEQYPATLKKLKETGKDPVQYWAGKVLKSGKTSEKQMNIFLRFSGTGHVVPMF